MRVEIMRKWGAVAGLVAVPALAVAVAGLGHSEGKHAAGPPSGSRAPGGPTTLASEPPVLPATAAAAPVVAERAEQVRAPVHTERNSSPPASTLRAPSLDGTPSDALPPAAREKAVAAMKRVRALVRDGRIRASSMTNLEHLDARIAQLESGAVMPDPEGAAVDIQAREQALERLGPAAPPVP